MVPNARLRAAILAAMLVLAWPSSAHAQRSQGAVQQFRALIAEGYDAVRAGNLAQAEKLARQALGEAGNVSIGRPEAVRASAEALMGRVMLEQGAYEDALAFLTKAQPALDAEYGKGSRPAFQNLQSIARSQSALARLADAETTIRLYLDLAGKALPADSPEIIAGLATLGSIYRNLAQYEDAERALDRALQLSESADGPRHAYLRDRVFSILALNDLDRGRLGKAEAHARRAVALSEKRLRPDHPQRAIDIGTLGAILVAQKRYDAAEPLLREALVREEKLLGSDHAETFRAAFNLARLLDATGRKAEAEALFRRTVAMARASGNLQQLASATRWSGRVLVAQGKAQEGIAFYRESLDTVDRAFAQTRGLDESVRQAFVARYGGFYREAVGKLSDLHAADPGAGYDREALALVSRTQSRIFSELLRSADAGRRSGDAAFAQSKREREESLRRVAELRRRLVAAGGRTSGASETEDPIIGERKREHEARIRRDLEESERTLAAVEERMWRDYPRYMELAQPRPVTAGELQQRLLRPGEAAVTYFLLDRKALAFVVTREAFRMVVVPASREELTALVRAVRRPEERAAESPTALAGLEPAALHRLYSLLVSPLEDLLRRGQTVLVVGDGPLHTLPLEMLVTAWGPDEQRRFEAARAAGGPRLAEYGTLDWLGERYRFAYLPSLAALQSQRLHPKAVSQWDRDLVSFADPVFGGGDEGAPAEATRAALASLSREGASAAVPRLPDTADEAREVAGALKGRSEIYLRERAQERTAKTLDLRATRFLHFATHGLLGGDFVAIPASEPDENEQGEAGARVATQPALALTLVGDLGGEDGLLTMGEVVERMDLGAQLVVLSACNTAGETGRAGGGEGFAGLTRAFMYAGARGLIVSHWAVESRATTRLVGDVFRRIAAGGTPLAALAAARHDLMGTTAGEGAQAVSRAHPYFWAPFVYVGD